MKEEEGRRNAIVEAFNLAEKRISEMKDKLSEVERDKKSAEATSKGQIIALKKKLEEAEKARDQAEQEGYDVEVAEIEEALRAEVLEVCRKLLPPSVE